MPNENRLISLDEALKATHSEIYWTESQQSAVRSFLVQQPRVDAVEVVRCKDCKHLNVLNRKEIYAHCPKTNTVFLPFELDTRTHFCSYGERKDNGKE